MSPSLTLARTNLQQRPLRTALLVASVALCAALISAIACAMASLELAVRHRIEETVGAADVRVSRVGGGSIPARLADDAQAWPGVRLVVPRARESLPLRLSRTGKDIRVIGLGIDPARQAELSPIILADKDSGRFIAPGQAGDNEIILEEKLAAALGGAVVGDVLDVPRFGEPIRLRVVGIARQPALSVIFDQLQAYVNIDTIGRLSDKPGRIGELDILIDPTLDPIAWSEQTQKRLKDAAQPGDPALLVQASAKVTSGLDKNIRGNQIGFILASTLAFVAAAFIITTGLTTNVTERIRELAVIRCIGGTRQQLARSQLALGAAIGAMGAVLGVPLGMLAAAVLVALFPDQLPAGFAFSWLGLVLGLAGSVLAGLIGGVWPAVSASRVSPLEGLSVRSRPVAAKWFRRALAAGITGLLIQALVLATPKDGDLTFWLYVFLGVPALMAGYFLISVPVTTLVSTTLSKPLSLALGLPGSLLRRTVQATPYRHGFTAGAMMLGLSMMVSIWTNGRSVLEDWLDQLQIPDAFVVGLNMDEATQRRIEQVPGIAQTCAITELKVEIPSSLAQGVAGLTKFRTSYIAFEPDTFFDMTTLTWVAPETPEKIDAAKARLRQGGALLVAREFSITRGIGPGTRLPVSFNGQIHEFEVVGVVTSPGLDIVSKFYDVGEGYAEQAVNAVFGSRDDLKNRFGADSINLIQLGFAPDIIRTPRPKDAFGPPEGRRDVQAVIDDVRQILGGGIREVGSAVEIKQRIRDVIGGSLLVASVVAIGAMLVACFAVANLIVAGIQARQFEFGVLRAVGAHRGLLARLVIGEALIIGIAACILGSAMGLQAAWGGQTMYRVSIGLDLGIRPPWVPLLAGCAAVIFMTLLASVPPALSLMRRQPRELMGAMKG